MFLIKVLDRLLDLFLWRIQWLKLILSELGKIAVFIGANLLQGFGAGLEFNA